MRNGNNRRWILVAALVAVNALLASGIASGLGAQHTALLCSPGQTNCHCTANHLCFAGGSGTACSTSNPCRADDE